MKKWIVAFILLFLFSCKKEKSKWITATVMQSAGCFPNSWLVKLDNPDASKYSFLCNPTQATFFASTTNCTNSAIILDLPASLSQPGTLIKFSQWTDKGLLCFSSTLAPHHLEVTDVSAK